MTLFLRSCSMLFFLTFSMQLAALDISKRITVHFATEANYYPFEYLDNQDNIQGFDIDMAKAICRAANLHCTFSNQRFDSLLLSLEFGRFDAAIAALDITKARQQKVDFSQSYYRAAPVFVGAATEVQPFDLADKFIGVQSDSSNYDYLIKLANKDSFIIAYPSSEQALSDLSVGVIDAVFVDQPIAAAFLIKPKTQSLFTLLKTEDSFIEGFSAGYGIAVKKGNRKLLERLNFGLQQVRKEGNHKKIVSSYFIY